MRDVCRVAEKGCVAKIRRDGKQFVPAAQSSLQLCRNLAVIHRFFHNEMVITADNSTGNSERRLPFSPGAAANRWERLVLGVEVLQCRWQRQY